MPIIWTFRHFAATRPRAISPTWWSRFRLDAKIKRYWGVLAYLEGVVLAWYFGSCAGEGDGATRSRHFDKEYRYRVRLKWRREVFVDEKTWGEQTTGEWGMCRPLAFRLPLIQPMALQTLQRTSYTTLFFKAFMATKIKPLEGQCHGQTCKYLECQISKIPSCVKVNNPRPLSPVPGGKSIVV